MNPSRAVLWILALALFGPLAACSSTSKSSSTDGRLMAGAEEEPDVLHLTTKEVVRGKVQSLTPMVILEREDGKMQQISPGAVYSIEYSKESYARLFMPMRPAPAAPAATAFSSWYPRSNSNVDVKLNEIDWSYEHPFSGDNSCVGSQIADSYKKHPEFPLFCPPGGKIVLEDFRKRDYHAHFLPSGLFQPKEPGAGLTIPLPEKDLPEAVAFVSPAMRNEAGDDQKHQSWMPSDALYALLRSSDQADAVLGRQPFAGGKALKTPFGDLWAFGLPKDRDTWYLYLQDSPAHAHSKVLGKIFAGFGSTLLKANLAINVQLPDGTLTGRVLVLPNPDAAADGPAIVALYTGTETDPAPFASVALPPRENIVTPTQPPATKADVMIQHYEIAKEVPQSIVIAYGTGRPTSGVTLIDRPLTPDTADQQIKLDFSSDAAETFPKVLWLAERRTYAWSLTGGRLVTGPAILLPAPTKQRLTTYKWAPPISHVLPILFKGPAVQTAAVSGPGSNAVAPIVGGMANGLIHDAMLRESGGSGYNPAIPIQNPGNGGNNGGGSSNTSVVNITVPPPGPGSVSGFSAPSSSFGGYTPPVSSGLNYSGPGAGQNMLIGSGGAMQIGGSIDQAGNYYNTSGQQTWNNQANTNAYYQNALGGSSQGGDLGVDQGGQATYGIRRTSRP